MGPGHVVKSLKIWIASDMGPGHVVKNLKILIASGMGPGHLDTWWKT